MIIPSIEETEKQIIFLLRALYPEKYNMVLEYYKINKININNNQFLVCYIKYLINTVKNLWLANMYKDSYDIWNLNIIFCANKHNEINISYTDILESLRLDVSGNLLISTLEKELTNE